MKKTVLSIATVLMVALALFIPNSISSHASPAPNPPAAQGMKGSKIKTPEMDAAIQHLEQAKEALQKARHDFGGHRAAALELVDKALKHCHEAIEFANK